MGRLRHNDTKTFSDALIILFGAADLPSLPHRTFRALRRLFALEITSFTLIDAASGQFVFSMLDPYPAGWLRLRPAVMEFSHLHPIADYVARLNEKTGSLSGSGRISDALSLAQWKRHPFYNEYFRHVGLTRQLVSLDLVDPARVLSVTADRGGRDFTVEEWLMFDLLRPHLGRAYQMARVSEQLRAEMAGGAEQAIAQREKLMGLCEVDAEGRVRWVSAEAEAMLARYGLMNAPLTGRPAPLLRHFLAQIRRASAGKHLPAADQALQVQTPFGQKLTVRLAAHGEQGAWHLLLKESAAAAPAPTKGAGQAALPGLSALTRREREVLAWVTQGKSNADIGVILGIAEATVSKHLEHVFGKLGVENRTAAARLALETPRPFRHS